MPDEEIWGQTLRILREDHSHIYSMVLKAISESMHQATVDSVLTMMSVVFGTPLEHPLTESRGYAQHRMKNSVLEILRTVLIRLKDLGPVEVEYDTQLQRVVFVEPSDDEGDR